LKDLERLVPLEIYRLCQNLEKATHTPENQNGIWTEILSHHVETMEVLRPRRMITAPEVMLERQKQGVMSKLKGTGCALPRKAQRVMLLYKKHSYA
jgi:hypothetical protein